MLPYCSFWPSMADRRWRPGVEHAPCCPRCDSSNTKFCYYNNYSLTQPRYFCKSCRRYWTKGGSSATSPSAAAAAVPPWADGEAPALISALPAAYLFRPDHALESMASSLMCPYLKNTASGKSGRLSRRRPYRRSVSSVRLGLMASPRCRRAPGIGKRDGLGDFGGRRQRLHQSLNLLEDWGVLGVL
ncbi:hypothetical protein HPP92_025021 [Vanilla planifolia]|uniref:Dof zinc finger protein n=1 Tax=Vanilla planifolia TaxID=51239 RepID=A0A835PIQ3_VANPL|nr:hypothetical protein HPP92_025021 [Vanilla planifolia]